ncbi:hypothetical protein CFP71_06420 [Amycolatopsis thailandensis]|uniref:Adenylyl/Guanylyl and SMODS C-terminal sensor domain-containing protein n=1 Tax=Amycolatopsis thailandensis TaxID=589330 RepID=A0A229SFS3_9PSEU|nr:hypothetical protein CFP71_06420 [Amycolatopsis thailandensis]
MVTGCMGEQLYDVRWKGGGRVAGRDPRVDRRVDQAGTQVEYSDFKGEHVVERYVVKDGVVARDRIGVPISNTSVKASAVS